MRDGLIGAGFSLLGNTGLHRLAAPAFRGLGGILMMHRVRPFVPRAFEPNRLLEISPAFLEAVLVRLRRLGYRLLSLDAAMNELRMGGRTDAAPFAVLTFDDGYRDQMVHAVPVLTRHEAPFTFYVTPGFAERKARLWWVELEEAVRKADTVEVKIGGTSLSLPTVTPDEKQAAFMRVYQRLRTCSEEELLEVVGHLAQAWGIDQRQIVDDLCMDWDDIEALARNPLATIGAHTLTHPRLAHVSEAEMRTEIGASRSALEDRLGRPVVHLAYPVGDVGSAASREFRAASDFGFASAVTTRPGLVYPAHVAHLTALPRVSVNGHWQEPRHIEVLLSGAAFALWNRGRKLNVA